VDELIEEAKAFRESGTSWLVVVELMKLDEAEIAKKFLSGCWECERTVGGGDLGIKCSVDPKRTEKKTLEQRLCC